MRQPIPQVDFRAPSGSPGGVEVLDLETLHERNPAALVGVHRPEFHELVAPTRGRLLFVVDFVEHEVRPGEWLWVRPGQVQQWGDLEGVAGTAVLFEAAALDPGSAALAALDEPPLTTLYRPGSGPERIVSQLADELAADGELPREVQAAVVRNLLAALVLRLAHSAGDGPTVGTEPFRRFRRAVEADFVRTRRVEDYAAMLGYSPRTLSRAVRSALGIGAKELIDRRVVLEAQRLLAHSDDTAALVAVQLGFDDAANFGKFFQLRVGQTPIGFRESVRGAG